MGISPVSGPHQASSHKATYDTALGKWLSPERRIQHETPAYLDLRAPSTSLGPFRFTAAGSTPSLRGSLRPSNTLE